MIALLDALAFSSLWVGAAAGLLCAAASLAMGTEPALASLGVAAAGTVFVYDLDRLRDLERDRATSPLRSAFVARHRRLLVALAALAALATAACAAQLPAGALALLAAAAAPALAHRRLKRFDRAKAPYVAATWLVVVVGLPAALAPAPSAVGWVAGAIGTALLANAIASDVGDREAAVRRFGARSALWAARSLAGGGVALALAAPPGAAALTPVPAATLTALAFFRGGERYGLLVVDGALLAGAAASLVLLC